MKVCPKCNESKEKEDYYNGKQSWCKKCQGDRYKDDKEYQKKFIKRQNKYRKTEKYKELHRKDSFLNWKRNPKKVLARAKLYYAVKTGKIEKGNCEFCESNKIEAHHKDYSKPLEVNWLCLKHHREYETDRKKR